MKVVRSKVTEKTTPWRKLWQREGAVMPNAGNSVAYKTGAWEPKKLIFNPQNCINCGLCWPVCPDDAIILDEGGNMIGIDLEHCKDCGLCTAACPANKNPDQTKHALYFETDYQEDF